MTDEPTIRQEIEEAARLLNRVQRRVDTGAVLSPDDLMTLERARLVLLQVGERLPLADEEDDLLDRLREQELPEQLH